MMSFSKSHGRYGPERGRRSSRRLDIQGLRAVAVLMVVAFHAGLAVPGGFVGVDVFFVISGFVITAMLQREVDSYGRIRLGRFYARRFKRLSPALALTVAVTMILSFLLLSPFGAQQTAARTAVGALFVSANLVIARTTGGYFDAPADTNPLLNTWSLSVEEQFYLGFPALLALGWAIAQRSGRLRWAPATLAGLCAAVSLGLAVLGSTGSASAGDSWLLGFYSPVTRAWEFAVGALLALGATAIRTLPQRLSLLLGLLGGVMLGASLWVISGDTPFPSLWTLLPVAGTLLLLASGTGTAESNVVVRGLASRPMVVVGDWSYSIYLWHWPFIVFAGLVWPGHALALLVAALASFGPAIASYRWVEQPIRNLPELSGMRMGMLAAATVAPPLLMAVALGLTSRLGWIPHDLQNGFKDVAQIHAPSTRGCHVSGAFNPRVMENCTWNEGSRQDPIYLVGDSQAEALAEAAIGAGDLLGRPVSVFTGSSCPVLERTEIVEPTTDDDFFPERPQATDFDHCPRYVDATVDWLVGARPGAVLIAGFDQYWWDPAIGVRDESGSVVHDESGKLRLMEHGLAGTVKTLKDAGHRVILVQSIPTFRNPTPIWDPSGCSIVTFAEGSCHRKVPVQVVDRIQSDSREALSRVAGQTGASVLDLRDIFCRGGYCSTERDGVSIYRDATHITVPWSERLAPEFADAVRRAGIRQGEGQADLR